MGTEYGDEGVTVVEVPKDPESSKGDPRALDGRSLTVSKKKPILSDKEESFSKLYAVGEFKGNAYAAAGAAGYSESFCKSKAHTLPKKPHIVAAINAHIISNHRTVADPIVKEMHERLVKIAKFDIGTLFETTDDPRYPGGVRMRDLALIDTSALKSMEVKVSPLGYTMKFKTYSAPDAIKMYLQATDQFGDKNAVKPKNLTFNLVFGGAKPSEDPPFEITPDGQAGTVPDSRSG